jgi:pimeloyl-ACP methyl ester carboxylesterase
MLSPCDGFRASSSVSLLTPSLVALYSDTTAKRRVVLSIPVRNGHLEVRDEGEGEPVVFVQTALLADELFPLASSPAMREYRRILCHRRGYGASSPPVRSPTIRGEAEDCVSLLDGLALDRPHLVGVSYSSAVALQVAADYPERIGALVLIEPPPLHTPSADDFLAANSHLLEVHQTRGTAAALDEFMSLLDGAGWRDRLDSFVDGGSEQMDRDARTFFESDIPALMGWDFGEMDVARIRAPVLYVGGTESGVWFQQVREVVTGWFPEGECVVIAGADHSLALTHPDEIGRALASFLDRRAASS